MRPSVVAALCLLSAALGAAGVLVAGEKGGWLGGTQLVVVNTQSTDATTVVVPTPVPSSFQPQTIYDERSPGVVTVFADYGSDPAHPIVEQGSGFVATRSGVIVTAAHVIVQGYGGASPLENPARAVYIQFADGDRIPARVVGWDPYDDIGVLQVKPALHALDPVPIDASPDLAVGQPIAAIGSPLGDSLSLSIGVISRLGRTIPSLTTSYDFFDAIQTDAPINAGSSGGPLLNAQGQVIGVNTQIRSSIATAFQGISYAVPVISLERSLDQLLSHGSVLYAYLGLRTENLTPAIARRFGYPDGYGAIVVSVVKGGPAARAGLHAGTHTALFEGQQITLGGDAIVAIDGSPVVSSDAVAAIVAERLVPGEVAWFTVVNHKRKRVVLVVLGTRPG